MKKMAAFSLALVLSAALSTTAFAADDARSVTVETHIAPNYIVTIPASTTVDFNKVDTDFGEIKLTAAQLDPGKKVKVALSASGELENKADASKTLTYEIQAAGQKFTSATYTTAGKSTALTIHIAQDAWNKAYAGDYADTVTFTISYE